MKPAACPHRKSLRLPDFDYSTAGAYFVTNCVHHWICLLEPSPVRDMIRKWWEALPYKYPSVETGEFVVMPNHIHGIITLTELDVRADLCVGPIDPNPPGGHAGPPLPVVSLPGILQWYKTMTTNEYIRGVKQLGWRPFSGKLWHRSYYEHIIRNEREFNAISQYIHDNPVNWAHDHDNPSNRSTQSAEMNKDYLNDIGI